MRKAAVLALALLAVAIWAAPAAAQGDLTGFLYRFDLNLENGGKVLIPNAGGTGSYRLAGNLTDLSKPTDVLPGTGVQSHSVHFVLTPRVPVQGWSVTPPPDDVVQPGRTLRFEIQINVAADVKSPFYYLDLVADILVEDGTRHQVNHTIQARFAGQETFSANAAVFLNLAPREFGSANVKIVNRYLEPHAFTIEETSNPCGFRVVPPSRVVVDALSEEEVAVGLVAPAEKLWYLFGDTCLVGLTVADAENPSAEKQVQFIVTVTGFSGDFPFFFNTALLLAALLLLVLFVRRRKERLEEQILGKPQKPWLVPVERTYLAALKRKDPRAWYVVRHHLMEEEYRSSLLWFKAYKAATRGDRKKERLILKEERRYAKWKEAWRRRIAKPLAGAGRFEAKLQRKLDRKARRRLRRERRRWRKLTRTLGAAHERAVERAAERHAKAARRAARKGVPAPEATSIPAPVLPAEPRLAPLRLAGHRWARKAARFRRRMEKRQGNLEVRFEKADARYLAALRRRVQRIARRLDDPAFVAEHPLLKSKA